MKILATAVFATCLVVVGCDDSTVPLADPADAAPERQLVGLWQQSHKGGVTYYHVGPLGGEAPRAVLRVVSIVQKDGGELEQPHQLLAFPTTLGSQHYLNVAGITQDQLATIKQSGWQAEMLNSYILLKYELKDDALLLWGTDKQAKKVAIQDGKVEGEIEGQNARFTDTMKNLSEFVAASGDELFAEEALRFKRVK